MAISRKEQLKILGMIQDSDIDYTDAPATDAEFWQDATVIERMGGYPENLLEGEINLSDRDFRQQKIAQYLQSKNQHLCEGDLNR
jgi:hypothetical protein